QRVLVERVVVEGALGEVGGGRRIADGQRGACSGVERTGGQAGGRFPFDGDELDVGLVGQQRPAGERQGRGSRRPRRSRRPGTQPPLRLLHECPQLVGV